LPATIAPVIPRQNNGNKKRQQGWRFRVLREA
jgi:hypothetical protein